MSGFTNVNGTITRSEDARVPVLDRGFLYGDSVYEVYLTLNHTPMFMQEHLDRARKSAAMMRMTITQSDAQIIAESKRTMEACELGTDKEFYVRWIITRGDGPIELSSTGDEQTSLIIIAKPIARTEHRYAAERNGLRLFIPSIMRNSEHAMNPAIKSGNYLNNVMALDEAKSMAFDDCLMICENGNLAECSRSNIWLVFGNTVVTPKGNNLRGITRKQLNVAMGDAFTHVERDVQVHEIEQASEAFITSTTRDVWPVCEIKLRDAWSKTFPRGGGEITRKLRALFGQHLAEHVKSVVF